MTGAHWNGLIEFCIGMTQLWTTVNNFLKLFRRHKWTSIVYIFNEAALIDHENIRPIPYGKRQNGVLNKENKPANKHKSISNFNRKIRLKLYNIIATNIIIDTLILYLISYCFQCYPLTIYTCVKNLKMIYKIIRRVLHQIPFTLNNNRVPKAYISCLTLNWENFKLLNFS